MVKDNGPVVVEIAAVQVQRAAQGRRFKIQLPADPYSLQPDPFRVNLPLLRDEQMAQHRGADAPVDPPGPH